ncbi:MAG: SRPBCC family protein [Actinomycetota bacterium]|nr:SRPBCC family protein [Actinomycetota bacterium]
MGMISASYTVEIDAPLAEVYEVAADVPGAVAWNPAMEKIEVIETDAEGRATLVEAEADVKVKKSKSILRFSYNEPDGLTWVQEKGDVKSVDGRWELSEIDAGHTRAVYALEVDPGRVLGMLLRGPVEGQVKEYLTKGAAEGLKRHIESP